jgi:hypothetical protein
MRSVTRLLLIGLFGLLLVMPALPACSTPAGGTDTTTAIAVAQQPTTPPPASVPGATTTAQPGVEVNAPSEADGEKTRRKLVMGVTSAVLVAIVIWGRSVRRKRAKKKVTG